MAALIRQGRLCKNCKSECADLGTEIEPISVECATCNGTGCDDCDRGYFKIEGCPSEYCNEMSPAIEIADWINEKQILPIAGGLLDQSNWILDAARRLRIEDGMARADE